MTEAQGNNPELWNKLLFLLDEKLQLGLLDHFRKLKSYHFEGNTLFLEPSTPDEEKYLQRSLQQISIFAQDATKVDAVKVLKYQ